MITYICAVCKSVARMTTPTILAPHVKPPRCDGCRKRMVMVPPTPKPNAR